MAYNSTLETAKIESALLASLKTKKIEYNITQDKSSNYASLSEAIAAVDDDEYKVKGIVLTFYTGTDWVSKRYNGEDASGFATETNWVDAGGAAGGTQYLDLSMFSSESGTLSEEDYQKVVKAYEDGVIVGIWNNTKFNILMNTNPSITSMIGIIVSLIAKDTSGIALSVAQIEINKNDKTYKGSISGIISLFTLSMSGAGTKALTDSGQYVDFAKPTKVENGGSGTVIKQINPNTFYKFGSCSTLTIALGAETSGIVNEYMFEFISGTTATTLSIPDSVKWSGGNAPTIEANKTYQVSIVDNLALIAAF